MQGAGVGAEARLLRRRASEVAARRLPVQLLFPLVLCTLPAFALLAVAHEEQLRAAGRREETVLAVAMLAIAGVAMLGDALVRFGGGHVHGAGR